MPRTMIVAAAAMVAVLVAAALALAQSQEEWREVADSEGGTLKLEQTYHGTKPGAGNTLPRVDELKGLPGTWVTWPGTGLRSRVARRSTSIWSRCRAATVIASSIGCSSDASSW